MTDVIIAVVLLGISSLAINVPPSPEAHLRGKTGTDSTESDYPVGCIQPAGNPTTNEAGSLQVI